MGLFEAYGTCIKKYATFEGRARRSEYWYFVLFNSIVSTVLSIPAYYGSYESWEAAPILLIINSLYSLFIILPTIAVIVRRLHDTGHSGAYYFIGLIPLVGLIILLVYFCRDSDPGDNQYGPNPKTQGSAPNINSYAPPRVAPNATEYTPTTGYPMTDIHPQLPAGKRLRISFTDGQHSGPFAEGTLLRIGRDAQQCQLAIPNVPGVSRTHCAVRTDGNRIEVRDLHSSYGTYLSDGTRIDPDRPVFVQNGAQLYLGSRQAVVSVKLV